ncbi:uncharacterized protein LOC129600292 [Paramacrobiotus metropolitanus]|uniref:uncharacterized protein LOC129600292 n=1 Tax=Paramacrobiotus metropolitanus TaxID=2943436 RepID=UPI00244614B5|nr:uncharacterized protein LOC129600292 [Paramacrobiotus metropolitanus]
MNATSRYFRKLFTGLPELNYGNTVLVQRDNDQWWLGYVQDIDGPNFYVDFDASSISAQWIHSSHLWPHHFLQPPLQSSSVHIALRRTNADPMVFWPGTLVDTYIISPFHCVLLTGNIPDGMHGQHIVHWNHCTEKLPIHKKSFFELTVGFLYSKLFMPEEEKSFFERRAAFLYKKHVIRFPKAQVLPDVDFIPQLLARSCRWVLPRARGNHLCDGNCSSVRLISMDEMLHYCNADLKTECAIGVGCRMFVRVGLDDITFICAEMKDYKDDFRKRITSIFWDEESLRQACDDYLTLKLKTHPVDTHTTSGYALNEDFEEMSISELAHPIVASVHSYLDVESQFWARRVCALWSLLSCEHANDRHILFDLCTNCERQPQDLPKGNAKDVLDASVRSEYAEYLAYKLVTTLDRVISVRTQTLALTEDGNHLHDGFDLDERMRLTAAVLAIKGVRPRAIFIKNGIGRNTLSKLYPFLDILCSNRRGILECNGLYDLMAVCEQLVLINFKFSDFIRRAAVELLGWGGHPFLPLSESKLLRRHDPDIDPSPVIIPCLRFHSVETATQHADIRIVLAALNVHCPAVSQRVFEKVTNIQARWVRTVAYPDQWNSIGIFLYLFNHLRPGDAPKEWDTMDLRQLDIAALSPITFAALDACYKDNDDNDDVNGDE